MKEDLTKMAEELATISKRLAQFQEKFSAYVREFEDAITESETMIQIQNVEEEFEDRLRMRRIAEDPPTESMRDKQKE
jgi:hypothetical protein